MIFLRRGLIDIIKNYCKIQSVHKGGGETELWWISTGIIGFMAYVAVNVLAFEAFGRLPNEKWTAYLLISYGILDKVIILLIGLRVLNEVRPIKGGNWDLIYLMSNADILYLKITILAYLSVWAVIMFSAYRPLGAHSGKIQGN